MVQAESKEAMANLAAIAAVDGVDGVFFGPADLSASMGYLGQPAHPEVLEAIDAGIATVLAAGKAPGIIDTDPAVSARYLKAGALFVAVGVEADLLIRAATDLAATLQALIRDAVRADGRASAPSFSLCAARERGATAEQCLSVGAASPCFWGLLSSLRAAHGVSR